MAMFQGKRLGLYATKVDAAVAYACAVKDQELTAEEGTHSGRTRARGNASKEAVAGSAQEQEEAEEEEELVEEAKGLKLHMDHGPKSKTGAAKAALTLPPPRATHLRPLSHRLQGRPCQHHRLALSGDHRSSKGGWAVQAPRHVCDQG